MNDRHDDLFVWDNVKQRGEKSKNSKKEEIELLHKDLLKQEEEIKKLTEENEDKQDKIAELNNDLLRYHADFDNFRKRTRTQNAEEYNRGITSVLKDTLNILDDFDRAMQAGRDLTDNSFYNGVELIYNCFMSLLDKYGVKIMDTVDKQFDPNLHEAISRVPTDKKPEYTIVGEMQKGYLFGDALLRPAKVAVAVAPDDE